MATNEQIVRARLSKAKIKSVDGAKCPNCGYQGRLIGNKSSFLLNMMTGIPALFFGYMSLFEGWSWSFFIILVVLQIVIQLFVSSKFECPECEFSGSFRIFSIRFLTFIRWFFASV